MTLNWPQPDEDLLRELSTYYEQCVDVYTSDRNRVAEDVGKERGIAEGGYGRKQIQELIQNAADALLGSGGRIEVILTDSCLYVANEGVPFSSSGLRALLYTHLSNKTGNEIGRFGLGFKSIAGISENPQIFSRSVSLEFNRDRTAVDLSTRFGTKITPEGVPALRFAWAINAQDRISKDRVLSDLSWAATIVKAPLRPGTSVALSNEIGSFDDSFSIFAPHVRELTLDDRTSGIRREFRTTSRGNRINLSTEGTSTEWLVVSREHTPSPIALESAGYAASRDKVKLSWAVPVSGGLERGSLSAFFPVKSELSLSGRVNAPWKLSDDRINVIECRFNEELLADVLPEVVAEARQDLVASGLYSRYIDVLPARGKEVQSWADRVINEPIYAALRNSRCLPDLDGVLHSPAQLKTVPIGLENWTDRWMAICADRAKWVHPDCTTTTTRRSKVERLMSKATSSPAGRVKSWMEGLVVGQPTSEIEAVAHSTEAILIGAEILGAWPPSKDAAKQPNPREDIRESRIVLLSTGQFQAPMPGRCFIAPSAGVTGGALVDARVTDDPQARAALEQQFNIGEFNDGSDLLQLLQGIRNTRVPDWDELWSALRSTDLDTVRSGFSTVLDGKAPAAIKVKGAEGKWVQARGRILPGLMRPHPSDSRFFVDPNYHRGDRELLELLGVTDRVRTNTVHPRETWISGYVDAIVKQFGDYWELGPVKRREIVIDGLDRALGPLSGLPEMSIENKVVLTQSILSTIMSPKVRVENPLSTATKSVTAPEIWWVRQHGMLATELGPMPVKNTFAPDCEATLGIPKGVLPTATQLDVSTTVLNTLRLRDCIDDIKQETLAAAQDTYVEQRNGVLLGSTYAWWSYLFPESCPARVAACVGDEIEYRVPDEVTLVVSDSEEAELREFKIPFLRVPPEDLEQMSSNWDFNRASDLPLGFEFDPSAESTTFEDLFPGVTVDEDPDILDQIVQPCSQIRKVKQIPNRASIYIDAPHGRLENETLLVTGVTDIERLANVLNAIGVDDSPDQLDLYSEQMRSHRVARKARGLRKFDSEAERLLDLVGAERLITLVPENAQPHLERASLSGNNLARLCVTLYGPSALEKACSVATESMPITPPDRWNGSAKARAWVKDLGFPEEWAGRRFPPQAKPSEHIIGPVRLDSLHGYQIEVSEQLNAVLVGSEPKRAIVMLPTGAGKTRVAVQTVVEAVARGDLDVDGEFRGPILWLADTEELCEQAVGTWADIWRGCGRPNSQLIVSRFWSSYDLSEESESGSVQVVVASWQKLRRAIEGIDYEWLREAPIVIIDEAHGATHKSYRAILSWLHRDQYSRDRTLIGLTATPFRGSGEDSADSRRLRRRFDDNIISFKTDPDVGPLKHLQRASVLSRVTTAPLEGGRVSLSTKETNDFRSTRMLPKRNETALGQDHERTERIVSSVLSQPDDWPILVFATSVDNARVLATVLTASGRPAASIDQDTPQNRRRDIIERFNNGALRVITNYGVLSQGFDAPRTRAVYVTRPTSSAVLYRQMVGRGMRGPKNGGTEEVLIVNVLDNIVRHEDALEALEEQVVPGLPVDAIAEDFGGDE